MTVKRTGPNSVMVEFHSKELEGVERLRGIRNRAREALVREGIGFDAEPELDAFTSGEKTLVFARGVRRDEIYEFTDVCALLDAAQTCRAPDASLIYYEGKYYISARPQPRLCEFSRRIDDERLRGLILEYGRTIIKSGALGVLYGE